MIQKKIKIGFPKGNVHGKSRELTEKLLKKTSPKGQLHIGNDFYDIFFLKHRDITRMVAEGKLDFGITSEEWIYELKSEEKLNVLKKLDWCDTRIALIVHDGEQSENKKCITEFYNIAVEYFAKKGIDDIQVDKISGSSEALVPTLYDCCIDCVETGSTLKENNLVIKDIIFNSSIVVVSNKNVSKETIDKFNDLIGGIR